MSRHVPTSMRFREVEFLRLRQQMEENLRVSREHFGFCALISCDLEAYEAFVREARALRRRPPGLYAYVARILGELLRDQPELLAARVPGTNTMLVPSRVDVDIVVEMTGEDGHKIPGVVTIEDVGNRALTAIACSVKEAVREAKRCRLTPPPLRRKFVPAWAPQWWRDFARHLRNRCLGHRLARLQAEQSARVILSSTTQLMNGQGAWGMSLYTLGPLCVTLGGSSKRPVVVADAVVARTCLDITLAFDHLITDGAPATRFISAFIKEFESGRLLREAEVE